MKKAWRRMTDEARARKSLPLMARKPCLPVCPCTQGISHIHTMLFIDSLRVHFWIAWRGPAGRLAPRREGKEGDGRLGDVWWRGAMRPRLLLSLFEPVAWPCDQHGQPYVVTMQASQGVDGWRGAGFACCPLLSSCLSHASSSHSCPPLFLPSLSCHPHSQP